MQVNQHDALRALREYIDSHGPYSVRCCTLLLAQTCVLMGGGSWADRNDTRTKPEIYRKTLVMYWKQIQFFGSLPVCLSLPLARRVQLDCVLTPVPGCPQTGEVVAGFLKDLAVFERKYVALPDEMCKSRAQPGPDAGFL
eukprot:1597315-Rhodomonas_salina.1